MLKKFREDEPWKKRIEAKNGAYALCLKKFLIDEIERKMFQSKTNRIKWLS